MAHLTAQSAGPAPAQRVSAVPPARRRSGLPGTLLSEFTKIRSVRSTWIMLATFFVGGLAAVLGLHCHRLEAVLIEFGPGFSETSGRVNLPPFEPAALAIAHRIQRPQDIPHEPICLLQHRFRLFIPPSFEGRLGGDLRVSELLKQQEKHVA